MAQSFMSHLLILVSTAFRVASRQIAEVLRKECQDKVPEQADWSGVSLIGILSYGDPQVRAKIVQQSH